MKVGWRAIVSTDRQALQPPVTAPTQENIMALLNSTNGLWQLVPAQDLILDLDQLAASISSHISLGYYFVDASGSLLEGEIVFADVSTYSGSGEQVSIKQTDLPPGAVGLGFFLIEDGATLNPGLQDGDRVTFDTHHNILKAGTTLTGSVAYTDRPHFNSAQVGPKTSATTDFTGDGGWTSWDSLPRQLADINGDGRADLVAFGNETYVAPGQADGTFGSYMVASGAFGHNAGWHSFDALPRQLGDVNGDGRADLVAFADQTYVALGQGDGTFGSYMVASGAFGHSAGWHSFNALPRQLGDVNGDGRADLVAFADQTYVAPGQADGTFGSYIVASGAFGQNGGWYSFDRNPRQLADVNGDGRADIVGFAETNVIVSLGQADGTFSSAYINGIDAFTPLQGGWNSLDRNPRQLADVNGDGSADLIGFSETNVVVSLGNGDGTFSSPEGGIDAFTPVNGGWNSFDQFPRLVADVDGNGRVDLVGFGQSAVEVSLNGISHSVAGDVDFDHGVETDEAPVFSQPTFTWTVDEHGAKGTVLGTVTAMDPNGSDLTYTIASGNATGIFAIDGATGTISVENVALLDYETATSHTLTIEASDGNLSDTTTVTINLNDIAVESTYGTHEDDVIEGDATNNTIEGLEGHDVLLGQGGNDSLLGGEGNDLLDGGEGNDLLQGDAGVDVLVGSAGTDTLQGGDGGDIFVFRAVTEGIDVLQDFDATEGDKIILDDGSFGSDPTLTFDSLTGALSADGTQFATLENQIGFDVSNVEVWTDVSYGTAGNDSVEISGRVADEHGGWTYDWGSKQALFYGGAGDDDFAVRNTYSSPNRAIAYGGIGNDSLFAHEASHSFLYGGEGDDVLETNGAANGYLSGGSGNDSLILGDSDSIADGGSGNDTFWLTSGSHYNTVNGGPGNDSFDVYSNNNTIEDGLGNNTFEFSSGASHNTIYAGSGADSFTFTGYSHLNIGLNNTIIGFNGAEGDRLTLEYLQGISSFDQVNFDANTGTLSHNGTTLVTLEDSISFDISQHLELPPVPTVTTPVSLTLDEHNSYSGGIGQVQSLDVNGGTLSYSVYSLYQYLNSRGNRSWARVNSANSIFAIDETGAITIADSTGLDYERALDGEYEIWVQTTDATGLEAYASAGTITLNDIPIFSSQTFTVAENSSNGTVVDTVVASDLDDRIVSGYTITAGNDDGAFAIDSAGQITLANGTTLDHETENSRSLTVQAAFQGTAETFDFTVTVDITNVDEAPSLTSQTVTIVEHSLNGTVVTDLNSLPDAADTPTHQITTGNEAGIFAVNRQGQITVANSLALDYETATTHTLSVTATDLAGATDSATVVVNLSNANDPARISDQTLTIPEHTIRPINVQTSDDEGDALTHSLTAGNESGLFAIDASTGAITVVDNRLFDYESTTQYDLTVAVHDGRPELATSATVTISLEDMDDRLSEVIATNSNTEGFVINGDAANSQSGAAVSTIGDLNNDGLGDLIVGAPGADQVYVVYGQASGTAINLSDLATGSGGFVLEAETATDGFGFKVSPAGDINGDGIKDFLVGAPDVAPVNSHDVTNSGSGKVYAVLGGSSANLSDVVAETHGFVLSGSKGERAGFSLSGGGDINGDGLADMVIGAPYADDIYDQAGNILTKVTGKAYVVFGDTIGQSFDLSTLDASNNTRGYAITKSYDASVITGNELAGQWVSNLGDFNGDGYSDIGIGGNIGVLSVNLGQANASSHPISANAANIDFHHRLSADLVNNTVQVEQSQGLYAAGDVNGDGLADVAIAHLKVNEHNNQGDKLWFTAILLGDTDTTTAVDISDVIAGTTTRGFSIIPGYSRSGEMEVSSIGDINGDGLDDLLIGYVQDTQSSPAMDEAYVVYGKTDFNQINLTDVANGTGGFSLNSNQGQAQLGFAVSAGGDINGDGLADLLIGAPAATVNSLTQAGQTYVLYGKDFSNDTVSLTEGTTGNDSLSGTSGANSLIGGQGDDTLSGGGGADVLYGGAGDDSLTIGDTTFRRIDGGTGTDTLKVAGSGITLDLASLRGHIRSIEAIDLTGSGNNTLALERLDLLNLSDTSNQLIVRGNAGDMVQSLDQDWRYGGTTILNSETFYQYSNGHAELLIQNTVSDGINPTITTESLTVDENSTTIGTVATSDRQTISNFAITGGNSNGLFEISSTGAISVASGSSLNYESATSHTLTIQATDADSLTRTDTVIITVNDVNETPAFGQSSYSFGAIDEHSAQGTVVGTVSATDEDAGDQVTYSITSGNDENIFAIDSQTGTITVDKGYLLDAETTASRSLTIEATDGTLTSTATATFGVNNLTQLRAGSELSFNTTNQSIWQGGDAYTFTIPPEFQNGLLNATFTEPEQTTLGFSYKTAGKILVSPTVNVSGGAVDATLPLDIWLEFDDEVTPGNPVTISSGFDLLNTASFTASSPSGSFGIDVEFQNFQTYLKYNSSITSGAIPNGTVYDTGSPVSTSTDTSKTVNELTANSGSLIETETEYSLSANLDESNWFTLTNEPGSHLDAVLETLGIPTLSQGSIAQSAQVAGNNLTLQLDYKGIYQSQTLTEGIQQDFDLKLGKDDLTGQIILEDGSTASLVQGGVASDRFTVGQDFSLNLPASADVDGDGKVALTARFEIAPTFSNSTTDSSQLAYELTLVEVISTVTTLGQSNQQTVGPLFEASGSYSAISTRPDYVFNLGGFATQTIEFALDLAAI
jgi:Ca2+-binding RTX toxin-like protein